MNDPAGWHNRMAEVMERLVAQSFEQRTIRLLPDTELRAAIAATHDQRVAGMIGKDFKEWDAMLFPRPNNLPSWGFHNKGVAIDLLIAFFDDHHELIGQSRMPAESPAPVWAPESAVYALELPDLGFLNSDTVLVIPEK